MLNLDASGLTERSGAVIIGTYTLVLAAIPNLAEHFLGAFKRLRREYKQSSEHHPWGRLLVFRGSRETMFSPPESVTSRCGSC